MVISFAHKQIIFSQHFQLHPVLAQLTFFPGVTPGLDRFHKEKLVCSRFFTARMPFCCPTNGVNALKGMTQYTATRSNNINNVLFTVEQ